MLPPLPPMLRLVLACGLLSAALAFAAEVRFDSRTSILSVPEIKIDGQTTISDVQLQLLPGRPWSLFSVGTTRSGISYPRQTNIVGFLGTLNPETVFKLADNGELWSGCSVTLDGWTAGDPPVTIYRTGENAYLMQFDGTITSCTPAPFQQFAGNSALTSFTVQPPSLTGRPGETLQFMVVGGTPPYSVLAANPALLRVLTSSIADSGLAGIAQLTAQSGDTVLIISDAAGRMLLLPVTGSAPASELQLTPSQLNASPGQAVVLAIGGGQPPYQVSITNGALLAVRSISPDAHAPRATLTVEALADQGNTQVVVVDATGATASSSVQLRPTGSASANVALAVTPARISATTGQRLNLAIAGGTTPYQVTSSQPALVGVRQINQDAASARATVTLEVLAAAGSTLITVIDANGNTASVPISIQAAGPSSELPLSLSPASLSATLGQRLTVGIAGGAAPYRLSLSHPELASIEDLSEDEASARASVTLRIGNQVGLATLTVSDANGAIANAPITIQAGPSSLAPLSARPATLGGTFGSAVSLAIAGGAAPYAVTSSNNAVIVVRKVEHHSLAASAMVSFYLSGRGSASLAITDAAGNSLEVPVVVE